jgi:hypothetical protein
MMGAEFDQQLLCRDPWALHQDLVVVGVVLSILGIFNSGH